MEVEAQARILMATLHGLMVQWHRQPGSVDWQRIAEEIIQGCTQERPEAKITITIEE